MARKTMNDSETVADQIVAGECCAQCHGPLTGDNAGIPCALCFNCSSSSFESRNDRYERRKQSRERAQVDYREASILAEKHGLRLTIKTQAHYQLSKPSGWLINVYPGNHRLYHDRNRPKPPYLNVPMGLWTLLDVVKAAIEANK